MTAVHEIEKAGALTQLRAYLAQAELGDDSRLPPERQLCQVLGISRAELRKALAQFQFTPARLNGCRRHGWATMLITFGK